MKNTAKKLLASLIAKTVAISSADAEKLLEIPPDSSMGDYAFPCFQLSKERKKAPYLIAQDVSEEIVRHLPPILDRVQASGPYVNFFLSPHALAQSLFAKKVTPKISKKETVVIEYVSPNTNKPLHLGHVRNAVLGGALANLLEKTGKKVVKTCLINDRGIHICKSMVAYKKSVLSTPKNAGVKGDHFVGELYVQFDKMLKENPAIMQEAQACLKQWEAGDAKTRALWKKMNAWVLSGMNETYKRLGVIFDKTYYESKIYDKGKDVIVQQLKKGVVVQDETGAIIARLENFGLPEKVLVRQDGTTLYITQDIYLAILRWKEFHARSILYVVGSEQDLYFKQLFATLRLFGYAWADQCVHVSYGMVNLPEGKMKSREGTVVDADDIITELEQLAKEEIIKRDNDLPQKEITKRTKTIALAALKFYMISVSPKSEMTFNPKESIALQGKTGPYILYTYARLNSILAKAGRPPARKKSSYDWNEEKQLLIFLSRYSETLCSAARELNPAAFADFLFSFAQTLNDYYHRVPVLTAGTTERGARLTVIKQAAACLKEGLGILGISTLERM